MKIFLDCGFYRGVALRIYYDKGIVDDSWKVYVFEPNPDLDVEQHLKDFPPPVPVELIKKAVWTSNHKQIFHIGGREDSASLEGTTGHSESKAIKVPAVNFSKFVSELPEAYIICSMDIEGAEFRVLPKMIKDGSIDKISVLDVEFHHRFMNEKTDQDAQNIITQLERRGVDVKLKVPLR